MMTREHFRRFAELISQIEDNIQREWLCIQIGVVFEEQDPRFDRQKWCKACRIK